MFEAHRVRAEAPSTAETLVLQLQARMQAQAARLRQYEERPEASLTRRQRSIDPSDQRKALRRVSAEHTK